MMDTDSLQRDIANLYLYLGQLERNILNTQSVLSDMRIEKTNVLNKLTFLEDALHSLNTTESPHSEPEK